jgi:hypothetical protein
LRLWARLRYEPRIPITVEQFADAGLRKSWIREKGMLVLNFHSNEHNETAVQ